MGSACCGGEMGNDRKLEKGAKQKSMSNIKSEEPRSYGYVKIDPYDYDSFNMIVL